VLTKHDRIKKRRRRIGVLVASLLGPVALPFLAGSALAGAPVLYVDQGNPACTDSGTSTGSSATPYCTINRIPSTPFGSGMASSTASFEDSAPILKEA
jgi:hypothetical protein